MKEFGGYRDLMMAPVALVEKVALILTARSQAEKNKEREREAEERLGIR